MLDLSVATYYVFGALVIGCTAIQYLIRSAKVTQSPTSNPTFRAFQNKYCVVNFLALFSDWLQGPYVYKLYSSYGFPESQITILYIVGFASSGVFGTCAGPITDRFGRKKTCVAFCIIYAACCLTKLSPNFVILLLGRIFGGIGTSLLFSAFEAWYVYEHTVRHAFPAEWMAPTFAKITFWNGVLAIFAGVVANAAAETMKWGPVAPFILAVPVLLICMVCILQWWGENYGEQRASVATSCMEGLRKIFSSEKILLVGVVQSLFESVMYMFVFIWTPVLEPASPPLGMVFACFMVCVMIGSCFYQALLEKGFVSQGILGFAIAFAVVSMAISFFATNVISDYIAVILPFFAFLLIEVGVGMYFPSISYLRSNLIPESHRAGIYNWFRAPMNVITCVGLFWFHHEGNTRSTHQIFGVCFAIVLIASVVVWRLRQALADEKPKTPIVLNGNSDPDKKPLLIESLA